MNEHNFAMWLQGFVELTNREMPTEVQWQAICAHLATVFVKITPEVKNSAETIVPSGLYVDDFLKRQMPRNSLDDCALPKIIC